MKQEKIRMAIPATGRLAEESLEWLAALELVGKEWAGRAVDAIRNVKKRDSEEAAKKAVVESWDSGLEGITLKYDVRSGWRAAFSAKENGIDGSSDPYTPIPPTTVTIYGSDFPTVNGIRESMAELAVIGFDELLATMLPYLDLKKLRRQFYSYEDLNKAVSPPESTDVRIYAPVLTRDVAGFFLIANKKETLLDLDCRSAVSKGKRPVYLKGRYQGLAYLFFGNKVDVRPTDGIEEALKEGGCYGFDIVRTGQTVLENGLILLGEPILCTMPVLTMDAGKYDKDKGLQNFIRNVLCVPRDNFSCGFNIGAWNAELKRNLGNSWRR